MVVDNDIEKNVPYTAIIGDDDDDE